MWTALFLVAAWVLLFSYQIFTQTAISTVAYSLGSTWLASKIDLATFVCSFAWMFVLSSIISSLIFGKERRLSVQFFVTLALTLMSSGLLEALKGVGLDLSNPTAVLSNSYTQLFSNSIFAVLYLAVPYVFMVAIDLQLPKKLKFYKKITRRRSH